MNAYAATALATDDLWHVQLSTGERRTWTLDQLDAAYRASLVDDDTYVCGPGSQRWATLGEVAGADADEPQQPVSLPPPPVVWDLAPGFDVPVDVGTGLASLEDDDELLFAPKRSKKGFVIAALVAMVAGGVGFAATRNPALVADARAAIASGHLGASVAAAAAPVSETPAPQRSTQSAWTPVAPPSPSPSPSARLNDDQKRALAAADKKHEAEQEKRHADRAKHAAKKHGKTGSPFHKGGDSHDPLNSAL